MILSDDEAVPEYIRWLCSMAHCAVVQGADFSLQINKLDGIAGFAAGGDSMRAVVAAFAIDGAVPSRMPVQHDVLWLLGRFPLGAEA